MVAECGDLVLWRSPDLEKACSWLRSVEISFSGALRSREGLLVVAECGDRFLCSDQTAVLCAAL